MLGERQTATRLGERIVLLQVPWASSLNVRAALAEDMYAAHQR